MRDKEKINKKKIKKIHSPDVGEKIFICQMWPEIFTNALLKGGYKSISELLYIKFLVQDDELSTYIFSSSLLNTH